MGYFRIHDRLGGKNDPPSISGTSSQIETRKAAFKSSQRGASLKHA